MELRYKIELGILSLEARLDDSGVFLLRGPKSQQLRWNEIEVADRHQAEKKLGTAPGFLKLAFVLIAVLLIIALVAVFSFLTALGPAFHFLALQRMLLDLQDGEYASFGTRLLTYVALFVFALLLRRWWRGRMARRRARAANSRFSP
jgi:hypothetical protein